MSRLFEEMDAFVTGYRDDADDAEEELDGVLGGLSLLTGWRGAIAWRRRHLRGQGDCVDEIVRAVRYCASMRYVPGDEDVRFVEEFRGPLPSGGLEVAIDKVAREFSGAGPLASAEFVETVLGDIGGRSEDEWHDAPRLCVDGMGREELEEGGIDDRMRLVLRDVIDGARGTDQSLAVFMWRRWEALNG